MRSLTIKDMLLSLSLAGSCGLNLASSLVLPQHQACLNNIPGWGGPRQPPSLRTQGLRGPHNLPKAMCTFSPVSISCESNMYQALS